MRCAINDEECSQGRLKRGLCEKHYRRAKKHGVTSSPRVETTTRYEVTASGCWEYTGPLYSNGYGKLSREVHGTRLAHRAVYLSVKGSIPGGLDLDHLCRVRKCVNPDHLEPVSRSVNLTRGRDASGMCRKSLHEMTGDNVRVDGNGHKFCVACWRARYKKAGAAYRARSSDG